jgi:hypothetical protein
VYKWTFESDTLQICTTKRVQTFGPNPGNKNRKHTQIACAPVQSLIYNTPQAGRPISTFGAISPEPKMEPSPKIPQSPRTMPVGVNSSRASLEHVQHVKIYIGRRAPYKCVGMLLTYQDGRAEALGQRPVGFPDIQTVLVNLPLQIHYSSWQVEGHWCLRIYFSTPEKVQGLDHRRGWSTRNMKGSVWWALAVENDYLQFCE